MSGFELNKIAASILLAGLIAMITGKITDILYKPDFRLAQRGFSIEIPEESDSSEASKDIAEVIKIGQLLSKADLKSGEEQAKKCMVCHNFTKDGPNKVGPDLWNIVDSPKAHHEGFSYSDAMKSKGGNWGYEDLYHFLNSPRKFIPGTKMSFAGLKKPNDIADTILYLRSLSDSPKELPPIEE